MGYYRELAVMFGPVITNLTKAIFKRQSLYSELLHPLQLLFIKIFQLVHGEITVAVKIHAPEPANTTKLNVLQIKNAELTRQ